MARFLVYDAGLFLRDGRRIRTAVVYTGLVRRAPDSLDIGAARYRVENVFIRGVDGDRVYDRLVRKVEAGRELHHADAVRLGFVVLMRHRRRAAFDVAVAAAQLARRLTDRTAREHVLAAIAAFGQEVFTADQLARLLKEEVFRMTLAGRILLEQGKAEGKAEGETKGRTEGRTEDILLLLRSRHGEVPAGLAESIRETTDGATLGRWLVLAADAASLAEFERGMA